jgi:hypothetical protein
MRKQVFNKIAIFISAVLTTILFKLFCEPLMFLPSLIGAHYLTRELNTVENILRLIEWHNGKRQG